MSIAARRLRQVHPHNPISLNAADAAKLGIANGDRIEVETPAPSCKAWHWCAAA